MNKRAIFAALLSILLAGLGQIYLKRWARGITFIFLEFSTALIALGVHEPSGIILNTSVSVIAAFDAYKIALNQPVKEKKSEIPEEIRKEMERLKLF